jgi:hypothetical protein
MKIKNVEQRSKEWFEMRLGVITGSRCGNVFKSNNLSFVDELIAERLSGEIVESPTNGRNDARDIDGTRGIGCLPNANGT